MRRPTFVTAAALAAALIVPPATFALQNTQSEDLAPGLGVREEGGIAYISGGIGDEQQNALARISDQFNLKLTLAMSDGKYMGGGDVRIDNQNGITVLETHSNGPLFFAKLPPGAYKVHVSARDKSFSRDVTITASGQQQLVLTWPATSDEPVRAGDAPE